MIMQLLLPFAISLFFSLIAIPVVILFAKKTGLVDDPKKHKHPAIIHKKPIPRAGGLPIYFAIALGSFIFLPIDKVVFSILISGLFVVIVGLLDDKYDLSPYLRFFANILCAGIVVFSGVVVPFVTNPLGGIFDFNAFPFLQSQNIGFFSLPAVLAIIWIVWVMNMLNWSKGVDGQMPGIVVVSALVIGVASLRFAEITGANVHAAQLSFIVAGASLGFLFYNFYPAKIFPGYSATILGFMIGVLSILSGVKLATAILVMGVPFVDAVITIARRILSKRSPFWHDKGHLHHLFLDIGLSQRAIAIFYWTMSALLGIFALTLSSKGKLFAIILIIVLVSAVIASLKFLLKQDEKNII